MSAFAYVPEMAMVAGAAFWYVSRLLPSAKPAHLPDRRNTREPKASRQA